MGRTKFIDHWLQYILEKQCTPIADLGSDETKENYSWFPATEE